jgi:hypothetical protein
MIVLAGVAALFKIVALVVDVAAPAGPTRQMAAATTRVPKIARMMFSLLLRLG